ERVLHERRVVRALLRGLAREDVGRPGDGDQPLDQRAHQPRTFVGRTRSATGYCSPNRSGLPLTAAIRSRYLARYSGASCGAGSPSESSARPAITTMSPPLPLLSKLSETCGRV